MLELLDNRRTPTWNRRKIVFADMLGDMLEFFDYLLIPQSPMWALRRGRIAQAPASTTREQPRMSEHLHYPGFGAELAAWSVAHAARATP
jgi:hypothetical protein